ncbi:MAG TPA: haloacid dehalogenase [Planctomycetes bacterium]|nr:haloacid dehalogenase [Planctomycetota bacterium]HIK61903.1 haloacid dehalogenase [Planctomycetota bacterium]
MQRTPTPPPYGTIVFDCDSTLSTIEGIEFLARDHKEQIQALTRRAMDGELPLEEVFGARLDLVRPSAKDLDRAGQAYVETALPHGSELCAALLALGKQVWILSGGLRPAVLHLARALGVADTDVHAVGVRFDAAGEYAGFDTDSPLARSGGKLDLLRSLARADTGPIALVGDGATDLEAAPACARFVAFGGAERREQVFAEADACCEIPDLAALLPLLTSAAERDELSSLPAHAALLEASSACHP